MSSFRRWWQRHHLTPLVGSLLLGAAVLTLGIHLRQTAQAQERVNQAEVNARLDQIYGTYREHRALLEEAAGGPASPFVLFGDMLLDVRQLDAIREPQGRQIVLVLRGRPQLCELGALEEFRTLLARWRKYH